MKFILADTFTDSLGKLTNNEQKQVKTTTFDLQINPAHPGLKLHQLERVKDRNFWSIRVSRDIRIIVHKTGDSLMVCYVDHHDKAYAWAERRKLETHPTTGAAQFVEIRESIKEIVVPKYVKEERVKPPIFVDITEETLLRYGVPAEWISDVLAANDDSLLEIAEHLPSEAAEALLDLATGGYPNFPVSTKTGNPLDHPDAQRRFRVMDDVEELERALKFPWDKWAIFLHPAQQQIVERQFNGPARISGSAGTGKTIIALHRAVYLTKSTPKARVLLTTFSKTLANDLNTKLQRLISNRPMLAERIDVLSIDDVAKRLAAGKPYLAKIASINDIEERIDSFAAQMPDLKFHRNFLLGEWHEVVDAWQLESWEGYRDVKRLGRKTRLPEAQRFALWELYAKVRADLSAAGLVTSAQIFNQLADELAGRTKPPYDYVVVDEAEDISVSQLRFLAAFGTNENRLFFTGDLGQRIFQTPFSWKSLGVDIRGRSLTLQINYRTSHQIRKQADKLLDAEVSDADGNIEERRGTVSVFNGSQPIVQTFNSEKEEYETVATWLKGVAAEGIPKHEIGIFIRSDAEIARAELAAKSAGLPYIVLSNNVGTTAGKVSIGTMHLVKGLEFKAVAVMACDEEIIPSQERLNKVGDNADLYEVYETERHLLYVACTRARERLMVSGVNPASEFLNDLGI